MANALMELEDLLAYCKADRRVCPMPLRWKELWELLPDKQQARSGWSPPLPLVLAAWETTTDAEKRERLAIHLRWASEHGALQEASALILSLRDEEWRTHDGDWGA